MEKLRAINHGYVYETLSEFDSDFLYVLGPWRLQKQCLCSASTMKWWSWSRSQLIFISFQCKFESLDFCRFEDEVYNEWTQGVDEVAKANLEKPLLLRDPKSSLISVNFDPNLVALLREVKYLEQREGTDHQIPESAAAIFAQNEMYRKFLQVCIEIYSNTLYIMYPPLLLSQNLDVTVALYNQVRETILDVEYPLIQTQLAEIDTQLEKAISQLNWTSEGRLHILHPMIVYTRHI